jgi:hypothetical protein
VSLIQNRIPCSPLSTNIVTPERSRKAFQAIQTIIPSPPPPSIDSEFLVESTHLAFGDDPNQQQRFSICSVTSELEVSTDKSVGEVSTLNHELEVMRDKCEKQEELINELRMKLANEEEDKKQYVEEYKKITSQSENLYTSFNYKKERVKVLETTIERQKADQEQKERQFVDEIEVLKRQVNVNFFF